MKKSLEKLLQEGVISPSEFKVLSLKRNEMTSSKIQHIVNKITILSKIQPIVDKITLFFRWFCFGKGDNFSKKNIICFFLTFLGIPLITVFIMPIPFYYCLPNFDHGILGRDAGSLLLSIFVSPILLLTLTIIGYKKNNVGIRNGIVGILIFLFLFLFFVY